MIKITIVLRFILKACMFYSKKREDQVMEQLSVSQEEFSANPAEHDSFSWEVMSPRIEKER